jgi:hypothetical protein
MSKPEGYYVDDIGSKPPQRERGCFYYGCLFSAILAGIAAILIVVAMFFLYRFASRTIGQYTDTAPMPMPPLALPKDEADAAIARAKAFKEAVDEGQAATLVLTGPELNALLSSDPNLAGRVAFDIVDDELRGWVSIPMDLPGFGRRYLNGKGALRASLDDDEGLVVHVQDLEVRGKPLPADVLNPMRERNLAENVRTDPEMQKTLRRIESLTIRDGKITIQSRERKKAEDEETDEAPAKPDEPEPESDPKPEPESQAPPSP